MSKRKLSSNAISVFEVEVDFDSYIRFTGQTLELGFYVACGKDGEPLEKPKDLEDFRYHTGLEFNEWEIAEKEYQEALDARLFGGWIIHDGNPLYHCVEKGNICICFGRLTEGIEVYKRFSEKDRFTFPINGVPRQGAVIEDLINSKIELTPTENCKKKLNL